METAGFMTPEAGILLVVLGEKTSVLAITNALFLGKIL